MITKGGFFVTDMAGWSNDRLTIGEVAKLHNIPVKTLRYWDEIGLFQPLYRDEETGYRYYSTRQFHKLNLIKHLKYLGVSSQEIIDLYNKADLRAFLVHLEKQYRILEEKMNELRRIGHVLQCHIKDFREALRIDQMNQVSIKKFPPRRVVKIQEEIRNRIHFEALLRRLEDLIEPKVTILVQKAVLTIAPPDFMGRRFNQYNGVFVFVEDYPPKAEAYVQELPGGDYAVINYFGNLLSSKPYYEALHQFIVENDYEICGDIERRPITITVDNNMAGYLAQICAPVRRKSN